MNELFLDTSFAVGVISPKDQVHQRAFECSERIEKSKIQTVTTQAVLLEIGNALLKFAFRQIRIGLLKNLGNDFNTTIITLTDKLYVEGFKLFSNRTDKEWGLVDCISFIVMKEREISGALTADEHYTQVGFHALLRK